MDILILRLDAPLMSFGGPSVDNLRVTLDLPGRAMLTGLLANALGYDHSEPDRLDALQARLRYAVRQDHAGSPLVDYQTVDLGQAHLSEGAWTTRGRIETRGGASSETTHIRYRHYLADALYTVALTLDAPDVTPTVLDLEQALRAPARPLFIGRKCCLPSSRILQGRLEVDDLVAALRAAPRPLRPTVGAEGSDWLPWTRHRQESHVPERLRAWYFAEDAPGAAEERRFDLTDDRDWRNQVHVGRRWMVETTILLPAEALAGALRVEEEQDHG